MAALSALMTGISKHFIQTLRDITYNNMARQASDWAPEENRIERVVRKRQPIKLDFAVPKKSRLAWVRRTI
jgi:hypothetical protein